MHLDLGLRKVQFIHGTAFVSLPLTWIRSCSIRKGDTVSIALREDGILEIAQIEGERGER